MPRMVLVCATLAGSPSAAHLLLFPRYHLDKASILARYPMDQVRGLTFRHLLLPCVSRRTAGKPGLR